jgi:MFS family permease
MHRLGLRGLSPLRLRAILRIKLRGHGSYVRLLVTRFAVLLGTYAVQSFALYYVRDAFQMANPARVIGRFMVVIALSVTVAAYPAGVLSERWGRRGLSIAACAMTGIGMILLAFTRDLYAFWFIGALIGLGMGIFSSVNWAWATDLVPRSEAGKYLGLSNLATAGSAATSRLFGPFIDLANAQHANAGYLMLFVLAAAGAFVALVLTTAIPETRPPARAHQHRWRLFGRVSS